MKVALVYDRVNKWGGAERVLLALHEIFPDAPLFTSVYFPENAKWAKVFPKVIPSFLQKIPTARHHHEWFAPLMPLAFESLKLADFDLIISVTSEAAKGIHTSSKQTHICYMLTPTRYLWSGYDLYFHNKILEKISQPIVSYLKWWDKRAIKRPSKIISISTVVQKRVKKYYNRKSEIIYPPVDIKKYKSLGKVKKENYYLLVSRLVPYKKVDLAIESFNQLGLPLIIVGTGSEEKRLRKKANKNIKFVGQITDRKLISYYKQAQALIFPQIEDFGLVAIEAMAAGTPVIAFAKGGAEDFLIDGKNGIVFHEQNADSLAKAVKQFGKMKFNAMIISQSARKFSKENFQRQFEKLVHEI